MKETVEIRNTRLCSKGRREIPEIYKGSEGIQENVEKTISNQG